MYIFLPLPDKSHTENYLNIYYSMINAVVLTGTFLAIIWYTIETNLMQEVIRDQIDISIMPSISVSRGNSGHIKIVNVGNGTACNICIKDINFDEGITELKRMTFECVNYLPKNEDFEVKVSVFNELNDDKPVIGPFIDHYIRRANGFIYFNDINGRAYIQTFSINVIGPVKLV